MKMQLKQKQSIDLRKVAAVFSVLAFISLGAFIALQNMNAEESKAATLQTNLIQNGDFSDRNLYWTRVTGAGSYQETNLSYVYGDSRSANYVAEIDAGSSFQQAIEVVVDTIYVLSFEMGHRLNAPDQTTRIHVFDDSKSYLDTTITFLASEVYYLHAKSFRFTPKSYEVQIAFSSQSSGTLGNIIDNVEVLPKGTHLSHNIYGKDSFKENIRLWLRADSQFVSNNYKLWTDIGKYQFQLSSWWGPEHVDGYNYHKTVQFNSNDQLSLQKGIFKTDTITDLYVFVVNKTISANTSFLYKEQGVGGGYVATYLPLVNNILYGFMGSSNNSVRSSSGINSSENSIYLLGSSTNKNTASGFRKSLYLDGSVVGTNDNNSTFYGNYKDFYLGPGGRQSHNGDISEMIFISKNISQNELDATESYLALKYSIKLGGSQASIDGIYTNSNFDTVWNASGNSAFHNQVIGIARDDYFHLRQKQSKQNDDSIKVYLNSLETFNDANTGRFGNDLAAIVLGHNNGLLHSDNYSEVPTEQGISSRIGREWRITNTNFEKNFNLQVRFSNQPSASGTDIRILVSDDDDFTTATLYAPTITNNAGLLTITGITNAMIPKNSTKYFTIAAVNGASLPVEFISFEANCSSNQVVLDWATATEINNDRFEIQRSGDGVLWEYIDEVTGVGNSIERQDYQYIDYSPISESYYRLKQIDFDGTTDYSEVVKVDCSKSDQSLEIVGIYPNPFQSEIEIEFGNYIDFNINVSLINSNGQQVYTNDFQALFNNSIRIQNLGVLPRGNYMLVVSHEKSKEVKQIIKN
ncbi:MAG: T9SS type A sorting domain-containing protein [Bacteroidia bacterium]